MARRPTQPLGRLGEEVAARLLQRRGLTILARNLRSRLGELDLVARDGDTVVFVEVKARRAGGGDPPQAAVDWRKQARLSRLALGYLAARGLAGQRCRFDVVAVTLAADGTVARVEHLRGAFSAAAWPG